MTKLLGYKLRCAITGIEGIANQHVEYLAGTTQYSVQPLGDGKTIPEGYSIDEQQLSIVDDRKAPARLLSAPQPVVVVTPQDPTVTVRLGDEVEDILTGTIGTCTRKITFINGCVYFDVVESKTTAIDPKTPHTLFAPHGRFKVVVAQKFQTERAKLDAKAGSPVPVKPTGGPTVRSARM